MLPNSGGRDLVPAFWELDDVAVVRRPKGYIVLRRDDWPLPLVLDRALVAAIQAQAAMPDENAVSLSSIADADARMAAMLRNSKRRTLVGKPYPLTAPLAGVPRRAAFKWAAIVALLVAAVLYAGWAAWAR